MAFLGSVLVGWLGMCAAVVVILAVMRVLFGNPDTTLADELDDMKGEPRKP